ncbi:MAG: JmjC domain-containing protein [Actinomycetota bacterium]
MPELELGALVEVVDRAPTQWVCARPVQHDFREARNGLALLPDPVGVLRGEADHAAYVSVANAEHLAPFTDLARDLEQEVRALVGRREGGLLRINLGLFVAPPGSVVPAHPDEHHNLLLQIAGTKTVSVETSTDRHAHLVRVNAYYDHPTTPTATLPRAREWALGPGQGVYIAPDVFHWVRVSGDAWSVALSVGFATPRTTAVVDARHFDRALRRRGIPLRGVAFPGGRSTHARARLARLGRSRRNPR